ncbi:Protein Y52B11A.4, partial [Aphelenchoides avenae]
MRQPLRSQSFRHRSRPTLDLRRFAEESPEGTERRRSTPTVSRRHSLQRHRVGSVTRTDVWPEPKHKSEIEERFLQLPDSEDYTRVRQFKIDAKGAVVSRGDSFRRKRNSSSYNGSGGLVAPKHEASTSPFPVSESDSPRDTDSRSTSVSSNVSAVISAHLASSQLRNGDTTLDSDTPSTSHRCYK